MNIWDPKTELTSFRFLTFWRRHACSCVAPNWHGDSACLRPGRTSSWRKGWLKAFATNVRLRSDQTVQVQPRLTISKTTRTVLEKSMPNEPHYHEYENITGHWNAACFWCQQVATGQRIRRSFAAPKKRCIILRRDSYSHYPKNTCHQENTSYSIVVNDLSLVLLTRRSSLHCLNGFSSVLATS